MAIPTQDTQARNPASTFYVSYGERARLVQGLSMFSVTLMIFAVVATIFASAAAAFAAPPSSKAPEGLTIRSVDGAATVMFRKIPGKPQPTHYEVSIDGIEDVDIVKPTMRLMGGFRRLTIGQEYTARVTAKYLGYPDMTSTMTFTPRAAPAMPSVKFTYGLGSITFAINTRELIHPAPLHGWLIRYKGQEVFTKTGRGIFTGLSSGNGCNQYEMWALYDLGQWFEGNPQYRYTERHVSTEALCPLHYAAPGVVGVRNTRIEGGYLYMTLTRDPLDFLDVLTVTFNGKEYRTRGSVAMTYPFRIKLPKTYTCRDEFTITVSNRLGANSATRAIGNIPEPDEDPVTCLTPGQRSVDDSPTYDSEPTVTPSPSPVAGN